MRFRVTMQNGDHVDIIHVNTEEEADALFAIAVASQMFTYVSAERMVDYYRAYDAWANTGVKS